MKRTIILALAIAALATPAFAGNDNGPSQNCNGNGSCSTTITDNSDTYNEGGAGGEGGDALAIGVGIGKGGNASASATNVSTNVNTNTQVSTNVNTATGGNAKQGQIQGQGQEQGQSQSQKISHSGNSSITWNAPRDPVSSANAAALVASPETCMGSTSIGAQFVGTGVSLGSTWKDEDCNGRQDAKTLAALGYADAARARLCQSENNRKAFEAVGQSCDVTAGAPAERPQASLYRPMEPVAN